MILVPPSTPILKLQPGNTLGDSTCFRLAFFPQDRRRSDIGRISWSIEAMSRPGARKESAKVRNRRMQRKFNGSPTKPRLSVFCSRKQLYAILIDDQNKTTLFYGSTLQKSIRQDPAYSTAEAAEKVGEELVKACHELKISEISSYDRNGLARGERMEAFEIAIGKYGFLPR